MGKSREADLERLLPPDTASLEPYGEEDEGADGRLGPVGQKASSTVTLLPATRLTWADVCAWPRLDSVAPHDSSVWGRVRRCVGAGERCETPRRARPILDHCFGAAQPGEVLALLGGSGAGKTTLMNVLTQRNLETVSASGSVRVNGVAVGRREMRKLCAYVQQDDLFFGTLTVREHLRFMALMKMGRKYPARERERRVRAVLTDLGLEKCADTLIGDPRRGLRGISGGERKRLAFGSEVMTGPPLLVCDEPTSGLDSHMARHTVQVLRRLAARKGMTVLVSIHQPSSHVVALFHRVCVLAAGRTAFLGSVPAATAFWQRLGDPVPPKCNPADHVLASLAEVDEAKRVCDAFLVDPEGERAWATAHSGVEGSRSEKGAVAEGQRRYRASWGQQFGALLGRAVRGSVRDPVVLQVRTFQTIVIALLLGAVYWRTPVTQTTVMSVNGALFTVVSNMNFMCQFTAVHVFCGELPALLREHQANLYRVLPYFLAKNVAEALQYVFYPSLFAVIVYWLAGLAPAPAPFLFFVLVCVLTTNVGISVSYLFACVFGDVAVAVSVMPVLVVPLMAFGGFFINSRTLPVYFAPVRALSYFAYAYEALVVNQWSRVSSIPGCTHNGTQCYDSGDDVIESLGFSADRMWIDVALLTLMIVVLRLLAFGALLFRVKSKK